MMKSATLTAWDDPIVADGCAYILDSNHSCGVSCKLGCSYCSAHDALCHIGRGTKAEAVKIREFKLCARRYSRGIQAQ